MDVAGVRVIKPRSSFEGEFAFPGDKSITHRALMLNAIADGESVISNASVGEDCLSTVRCLRELGVKIEQEGTTFRVCGTKELLSGKRLDCGNSGTTMRLLTGLLAGKNVEAELYGDESLSSRPMSRVVEPLIKMGANAQTTGGKAPIKILPAILQGAVIRLPIASAQVKSAALLAGLSAETGVTVIECRKTRDHTERMLEAMGANIMVDGRSVFLRNGNLKAIDVTVPGDISSAAYFMALGALKGKTLCRNIGVNPTRSGILQAFDRLGVNYTILNKRISGGEPMADILVEKSPLRAIEINEEEVPYTIDELPVLALLCAFAEGESLFRGAKELRYKESDRIKTTAELINNLGGECIEREDGWIIRGKGKLLGGSVNSYGDHRIVMTGAVGLLASQKGGELLGAECHAVSFPDFFKKLEL